MHLDMFFNAIIVFHKHLANKILIDKRSDLLTQVDGVKKIKVGYYCSGEWCGPWGGGTRSQSFMFYFFLGGEGYTFSILYVLFLVPSFVTSNDAILRTLSLYDNRVAMNRYADCFDPVKSKNNGMMI